MAKKEIPLDNQRLLLVWLWVIGGLIFIGGLWAWYQYVHQSTYGVFWDTIDNNLRINGVTRGVEQDNNGAKINQKLQISLGAENLARGITTVTQPSEGGTTTVVTETLGTPTKNFARYIGINVAGEAAKQPNVSAVKNVWSQEPLVQGEAQNQSVFAEGLFSSVPFANLTQPQRQELVKFMKDNKVYEIDYKSAKKVERAGKRAIEYKAAVNLKGYIGTLKMIDEMMGLKQLTTVNPDQYEGADPAQLIIVNSIDGRQLLEVTYDGSTRKETYSSYGARIDIDLPETSLLRSELEQKIQTIFAPSAGT